MEAADYKPPANWDFIALDQDCGHDWDTLFYRTDKWSLGYQSHGCLVTSRSYAAGTFISKADPEVQVTVLGAHFPQTLNASTHAYEQAAANASKILHALGAGGRTILLADTNTEGPAAAAANASHHGVNKTNAQLMADLGVWNISMGEPPASPLYKGCCYSDAFSWQGDRIVATFGKVLSSKVLFDPAPSWASFVGSEFHKGVTLSLSVD